MPAFDLIGVFLLGRSVHLSGISAWFSPLHGIWYDSVQEIEL